MKNSGNVIYLKSATAEEILDYEAELFEEHDRKIILDALAEVGVPATENLIQRIMKRDLS